MLLWEILRVALESLRANKLRSALTMLGIVIGVGAVITMVALGRGARTAIQEQIAAMGTDVLTVRPGQGFGSVRILSTALTVEDAEAVAREAPLVSKVAPEISGGGVQIEMGGTNANVRVTGSNADFAEVNNYRIALGRFYTPREDQARRRVAVLGGAVPEVLGTSAAGVLGQTIRIRDVPFEVVGILEEKGSQGFFNPDEQLLIPLQTARFRVLGSDRVSNFSAKIVDPTRMSAAMAQIERVLRREHRLRPGQANDFWIQDRQELLGTQEETTKTFTFLLAGIAAVSLLVGGIGIMNIMLVSVTERTREIGVRKALGATRRAILAQFLLEALVLCVLGGIVGIVLGAVTSKVLSDAAHWNMDVSVGAVLLAVAFSAGVGLFFGLWPANRAARLDPIVALRYE